MSEIILRQANDSDLEKILHYINTFSLDGEDISPEQFVVAEIDSKLAGFGRIKSYKNIHELASIGVIKEYRNLGVGSKIVNRIIEIFPENIVWLTTKNPDYFKKLGFVESNTPPKEIAEKCNRICSDTTDSRFMFLNK